MEAARVMSGMWLQGADSISSGNSKLLMIFIGIVALSMLAQAIVVIVAGVAAMKVRKRLMAIVEEVRLKALPVIDSTQTLIHELQPKVRIVTDNVVETSHIVRSKAQELDTTVSDVNQKTRAQAARVDEMVTSVLDTTSGIASTIQKSLQIPVREFTGLINGFKAGMDVLVGRNARTNSSSRDGARAYSQGGYKNEDAGL